MVDNEQIRKQFIDGEYAISDHAIIKARKDGISPRTVEKLEWAAKLLPSPHVGIQFPFLDRNTYARL